MCLLHNRIRSTSAIQQHGIPQPNINYYSLLSTTAKRPHHWPFTPDSFGRVLTFIQGFLGLIHSLVNLILVTQDEGADEAVVQCGGAVPLRWCKAPHQEDALHTLQWLFVIMSRHIIIPKIYSMTVQSFLRPTVIGSVTHFFSTENNRNITQATQYSVIRKRKKMCYPCFHTISHKRPKTNILHVSICAWQWCKTCAWRFFHQTFKYNWATKKGREKKRSEALNAGKRRAQVREITLLDKTSHSPPF